jgi:branched-chain amino acid transport system substrate-binding protein
MTISSTLVSSGRRSILVGGAAVAVAPSLFNIARAQTTPIKIGFPVPLTGAFSAEAQDQVRCAEIAIKEFNESGGYNGRKAELLVRDDKLNPGEAATRTLELIEKDKVDFVVGSLSAATQLSINAVCRDRKIICHQRGQRLVFVYLPRGAHAAPHRRCCGALCVS